MASGEREAAFDYCHKIRQAISKRVEKKFGARPSRAWDRWDCGLFRHYGIWARSDLEGDRKRPESGWLVFRNRIFSFLTRNHSKLRASEISLQSKSPLIRYSFI